MIPVPTERPDADAPVPQDGTEQAAADQAAAEAAQQPQQLPPPAEQSSTADNLVADIVGDVADVVGSIILGLLDD